VSASSLNSFKQSLSKKQDGIEENINVQMTFQKDREAVPHFKVHKVLKCVILLFYTPSLILMLIYCFHNFTTFAENRFILLFCRLTNGLTDWLGG
jgi:hypothetical protein